MVAPPYPRRSCFKQTCTYSTLGCFNTIYRFSGQLVSENKFFIHFSLKIPMHKHDPTLWPTLSLGIMIKTNVNLKILRFFYPNYNFLANLVWKKNLFFLFYSLNVKSNASYKIFLYILIFVAKKIDRPQCLWSEQTCI